MNKILGTLWVLIIIGAIFIGSHLFGPNSGIPENSNESNLGDSIDIIKKQEIVEPENNKTYTEYIQSAEKNFNNGELNLAIKNYIAAVQLNPRSKDPLIALANTYLANNQPEEAKKTFRSAQDLDPYSSEIQIGLIRSYINLRNIEKAKEMLNQMEETDPIVQYYKGIISILYKNFDSAKEVFTFLATNENEEFAIPNWIKNNSQNFVDAFETFNSYSEGEEVHLKTLLAKALSDTEEFNAAIPLLYDVIAEKNDYRDAWIVLGYCYLNTNKIPDAIDAFTQAKALNENKPETLFYLGLAYYANNDIDKAIYFLEAADKNGFEPRDEITLRLGDLYLLKENYDKSAIKYEETLSLNKKSMDVYVRAIWLNINKLNDPNKALKLSKIALENNPDEAMSYNLIGWSYIALNDFDEADKYLNQALAMNPEFDAAHLNFGWLYELEGKTALAKEYYKKAYMLGKGGSIGNLAAHRFNHLTESELKNKYLQVNISAP